MTLNRSAKDFIYSSLPTRVLFGAGTIHHVKDEAARLGIRRALVLTTPNQKKQGAMVSSLLSDLAAAAFTDAAMHTPVEVTQRALDQVLEHNIDGYIAIGGGSTTGLSKALALRTNLPQLIIPTTYAGSEMTPILGQTEKGRKITLKNPEIQPETVIYDSDLTLNLPVSISVSSSLNAIAHAVEALYAYDGNPVIDLIAQEGIRALAGAVPTISKHKHNQSARHDALYGAWLCGICLGSVSMALHHKLCHTLGGMFNLPHAETHAILLPYIVRYNASAASSAFKKIAHALNVADAAQGLQNLSRANGIPVSLRDIGMPKTGIEQAASEVMKNPYRNPEPLTREGVHKLLAAAWSGSEA